MAEGAVAGAPIIGGEPADVEFTETALLEAAAALAGADNPGDDSYREPLAVICAAFENEAGHSAAGRVAAHGGLVGMLARRMQLVADVAREPTILEEVIMRPLVITGLPRTGTTLLHGLLASDPAARAPLQWEVDMPSPPPASVP